MRCIWPGRAWLGITGRQRFAGSTIETAEEPCDGRDTRPAAPRAFPIGVRREPLCRSSNVCCGDPRGCLQRRSRASVLLSMAPAWRIASLPILHLPLARPGCQLDPARSFGSAGSPIGHAAPCPPTSRAPTASSPPSSGSGPPRGSYRRPAGGDGESRSGLRPHREDVVQGRLAAIRPKRWGSLTKARKKSAVWTRSASRGGCSTAASSPEPSSAAGARVMARPASPASPGTAASSAGRSTA